MTEQELDNIEERTLAASAGVWLWVHRQIPGWEPTEVRRLIAVENYWGDGPIVNHVEVTTILDLPPCPMSNDPEFQSFGPPKDQNENLSWANLDLITSARGTILTLIEEIHRLRELIGPVDLPATVAEPSPRRKVKT